MKRLINLKTGAMMLLLMALSGTSAYANVEDFVLSVRNVTQRTETTNILEFDLYLLDDDDTQAFEFAGCQIGLLLNSSIFNGGTLTVTIDNSESELDPDQFFVNAPDVVTTLTGYPGQALIRLAANNVPPVPPGAGSGTVISATGDGTLLTHFVITSTEEFAPNSYANLEFTSGLAVSPLYQTIVYTYISGTSEAFGVTPGVDAIVDGNPLLNPTLPAAFNVTGTGSYCQGGAGLPVGLDGSEAGVSYTLYQGALLIDTETGTGTTITFGSQTEGTYNIAGTNAAGTTPMSGQAVITAVINTVSAPTSTPTLCINTALTAITHTTSGATGIGTTTGLPAGVGASWASNTITISGTPIAAGIFNYSIPLTGGCGTVSATGTITVAPANTITLTSEVGTNNQTVCVNTPITAITYATTGATGATVSGLPVGVSGSWSSNVVTINGTPSSSGTFNYTVTLSGGCGTITANGTMTVNICTKTLNLTLFLEGLYNGANGLVKVQDCNDGENSFNLFSGTISDTLTVELAQVTSPYTTVFKQHNVPINTNGTITLTSVPGALSGNYYIIIKHRNHIETWSQSLSFDGTIVSYDFTDAINKAWGDNMVQVGSIYCIYTGDTDYDQYVGLTDLYIPFNLYKQFSFGYQVSDINADGFVDLNDLYKVFNNYKKGVGMNTPLAPL